MYPVVVKLSSLPVTGFVIENRDGSDTEVLSEMILPSGKRQGL